MPVPKTAEQARNAIKKIINEQAIKEAGSPYDKSVCITAVTAARDVFEGVEVSGSATQYIGWVYDAISRLQDNYSDSDGQYTNGKAPIGSVLGRLSDLKREIDG